MAQKIPLHAQAIGSLAHEFGLVGACPLRIELCFLAQDTVQDGEGFDDLAIDNVDASDLVGPGHQLLDGAGETMRAHAGSLGQSLALDLGGPIS